MPEEKISENENRGENSKPNEEITKNQSNENFKYRLERAKEQGIKQVLADLGAGSIDEVKEIYKRLEETTKNYEKAQTEATKAKVLVTSQNS
jgi:hypothetical protein